MFHSLLNLAAVLACPPAVPAFLGRLSTFELGN